MGKLRDFFTKKKRRAGSTPVTGQERSEASFDCFLSWYMRTYHIPPDARVIKPEEGYRPQPTEKMIALYYDDDPIACIVWNR